MKEFKLLIRNEGDTKAGFSQEKHTEFLKACEVYIESLKKDGKLISAQPLVREGTMLSHTNGVWNERPFTETNEVIVGYYHIRAKDLHEAIDIAKGNPEFAYNDHAKIEVRPIKMAEESTAYVYPTEG